MRPAFRCILLVFALLLAAGCSGVKNCSSSALLSGLISVGWSQTCRATYDELTEWEEVRILFDDISILTDGVAAEVTLSVESGTVQLSLRDENNLPVLVTASAAQPATYSGTAYVSPGPAVRFVLTPMDGTARGVKYEVKFSG